VRRSDVLSAWSGIRPLAMDPSAKNTESISRDHVVFEDHPGLITITGGKWTTYRRYRGPTVANYILCTHDRIKLVWFKFFPWFTIIHILMVVFPMHFFCII
jgi:hypothetical protein